MESDRKVYWVGVEFLYLEGSEEYGKSIGGLVYAFTKAFDAREAWRKVKREIEEMNLGIKEVEFISPYDKDTEWEDEEDKASFLKIYEESFNSEDVFFDTFYIYDSEEDEEE